MLEDKVAFILQKYLGNYVIGLSKEALNISVWKGDVELKNMQLRPEALNDLKLPIKVKSGFLGSVKLKVPWSKLGQEPVLVYLDRIFLLAEPATKVERCSEDEVFETKISKLKEMETKLLESELEKNEQENSSWLGSLINTIIGNIKLSISNIHIRYEDTESHPGYPFAVGITLEKLAAVTVDDLGKEIFVTGGALERIQKLIELERLAIYFDSNINPWKIDKSWKDLQPSEWSKIFEPGIKSCSAESPTQVSKGHSYIIHPVSGHATYSKLRDKDSGNIDHPDQKAIIHLDDVTLCLSQAEYQDILKLAENFSFFDKRLKYAHYRPVRGILEDAKSWWQYAYKTILEQQRKSRGYLSWEQVLKFAQLRKRYVSRYVSCLQADPSCLTVEDDKEIREMDRNLDTDVIIQWRMLAHRYIKQSVGNNSPYRKKQTQKGWWPFGGSVAQTEKDGIDDRERILSPEEWQQINKLLGHKEDSQESILNSSDKLDVLQTLFEVNMGHNASRLIIGDHVITELSSTGLHCTVKLYPKSKILDLQLQSYELSSPEGLLIESATRKDSLKATFSYMPFDLDVDWSLFAKASPCYMTYLKPTVDKISSFFENTSTVSQTVALETAAAIQTTFNQVRRNAQLQFHKALEDRSRFSLDLDIAAPKVTIPTGFCPNGTLETKLHLDLGHFTLKTEEIKECESPEEKDIYIQFRLGLNEITAFLVDGQYNWREYTQKSKRNNSKSSNCFHLPVLDECGIMVLLQQMRIPHPLYPETRIAVRLPSLGFHFSPALYHRLMQVAKLFQNESSDTLCPWDSADFYGSLSVLSWKGVGSREAVWQHCYGAIVGPFLYILDSIESRSYKHRMSLSEKQVYNVPAENIGNVENVIAVCESGHYNSKIAESTNALILRCDDENSRRNWQTRLQGTIYNASASSALPEPGETATNSDSTHSVQNVVEPSKKMKIFLTGVLDELIINVSNGFQGKQHLKDILLTKEQCFLKFRAIGSKVEFAMREYDMSVGAVLESLVIEDFLASKAKQTCQYLACSFIDVANTNGKGKANSFAVKEQRGRNQNRNRNIKSGEFYFDTKDDLVESKNGHVFDESMETAETSTEFFDAEPLLPADKLSNEVPMFKKTPGLLPDVMEEEKSLSFRSEQGLGSFITAQVILLTQNSPSYDNTDKKAMLSLATLSFYFNRPTIVEIMNLVNSINADEAEHSNLSTATNQSADNERNSTPRYERNESVVKGLLGKGKDRVIFSLVLDMSRAQLFLNNESGMHLASLSQDNLHIDIKVFPSSFGIKASLGNLKISDGSLSITHPYYWICDMRDPHGTSFVKLEFTSFNKEEEDYQGYDYSLLGELSEVRFVFLNRFIQEVAAYFTGLLPKESSHPVKIKDRFSNSEKWFTESEVEGSPALLIDLSLRRPVIIMPRRTDSTDFLELDVVHITVQNGFSWVGGDKKDPGAVHIENTSLLIQDVNLVIGVDGKPGERIIEDVHGLSLNVKRSLRDLWHEISEIEASVKIERLKVALSAKEYQIITECMSSNISEKSNCPPPLHNKIEISYDAEITQEVSISEEIVSNGFNSTESWVTIKVSVEIDMVELGLYTGSSRDAPLATMQIIGAWFLYRACSNGDGLIVATLKCFSVTDDRVGTEKEFRHTIGKANSIEYSPFGWVGKDGMKVAHENPQLDDFNVDMTTTMFLLDVKLSESLSQISISIQRPQLLVALDFLLSVAEFFVPSLPGTLSSNNGENLLDVSGGITLKSPVYQQEEEEITLSPARPLVVDNENYDNFVYNGNGGQICLADKFGKDLTEPSKEAFIFIGSGKSLQFKDVIIKNGGFLDSCIFLGSNSSYSVASDDGVFLVKGDNSGTEDVTDNDINKDLSRTKSRQNKKSPDVVVLLQAIGPEFTFYTTTNNDGALSTPEKLLHAEVDMFSRLKISEDTMELNLSALGLRVEASSGVRVVEPFDTIVNFTKASGKTRIRVNISELYINFSYSILQLFIRIEEEIVGCLNMNSKEAVVECYQFDKIWTGDSDKHKHTFWRPQAPPGFAILGDCVTPTDEPPSKAVVAVNASYAKVKRPLRFELIWSSSCYQSPVAECQLDSKKLEVQRISGSGFVSHQDECTVWMPIAPDGYVALGCVVTKGRQEPLQSSALCISSTLLTVCELYDCIFVMFPQENNKGTQAFWRVDNSLGTFLPDQSEMRMAYCKPYDLRKTVYASSHAIPVQHMENSINSKSTSANEQLKVMGRSAMMSVNQTYMNVSEFELIWTNKGVGTVRMMSIWRPIVPPGCIYVGDIVVQGYDPPVVGTILQDASDEELFKLPLDFQKVGMVKKSRNFESVSFWYPRAPAGYVSLGCVASKSLSKPEGAASLRCVRSDLVIGSNFPNNAFWDTAGATHGGEGISIWLVDDKYGTFMVWKESEKPPERLALCLPSENSEEANELLIDLELQKLSATLVDDFGGTIVPLLNVALTSVTVNSFGSSNYLCSTLRFSFLAKSYNERRKAWEPLVEPVDGWVRYEYSKNNSKMATLIRIVSAKDVNLNLSVSNINMLMEAVASWNRLSDFNAASSEKGKEIQSKTKDILEREACYTIPQNKLGRDIFLRIIEFGGHSEVISLPPGDVITVKVPASESILDPHSKGQKKRSFPRLVTVIINDGEFPKHDSIGHPEYMASAKLITEASSSKSQPEMQALHTRCRKAMIHGDTFRIRWNETFYIKIDTEEEYTVEFIVTDPIKDVCIGTYLYPLTRAATLTTTSSNISHQKKLDLAWEELQPAGTEVEEGAHLGRIRFGVFVSSILNDDIYNGGFSSGIKTGIMQVSPSKNGPWTTVNLSYSSTVACWKLGQNLIASEVFNKGNNKYLIIRSLVSVVNHTDIPVKLRLFHDTNFEETEEISKEDQEHDNKAADMNTLDEVFENEKYHPLLGWGSSYPGHLSSSDPSRWTRSEDDFSAQEFPDIILSPGWEWCSDWHVDKTNSADADGWIYASDFQNLKWPGPSETENTKASVRQRRWIRTRQRLSESGHQAISLGILKPGDSVALPMQFLHHSGPEYCLQVKPIDQDGKDTFSWCHVVKQKAGYQSSSMTEKIHIRLSSLQDAEELLCSSGEGENKKQDCLWFCLRVNGCEIDKDSHMTPINDWKLTLTAPLTLVSFLPVSSEFSISEKFSDSKLSICQRGIVKSGESIKIYHADLCKPFFFSLIPQGGWEPVQEAILIYQPDKVVAKCYALKSTVSRRIVQVMLDFVKEENDVIAKTMRIYTQYWLECISCPPLQLRFVIVEQSKGFIFRKNITNLKILEEVNHEETEEGSTILSIFDSKSLSLSIALDDFSDQCFRTLEPLSVLSDADGSICLKAHGIDNQCISLFISTKPCPYQSAPTKVICIRPYMTFTNRTGQCLYLKLSKNDYEKCLRPEDSRVTYCMTDTDEQEKLQIHLQTTEWSYPVELKEDSLFIVMRQADGKRLNVRADIRGYQEGSRFLIVFRLGSTTCPFRIENRTNIKLVKYRQSGLDDTAWQLLKPLSTSNFAWEDPCGQESLDVVVEHLDTSVHLAVNISTVGNFYPCNNILLCIIKDRDIKVVKFIDNESDSLSEEMKTAEAVQSVSQIENQPSLTALEFTLEVGIVGLSLIDQKPREILYLYLENVYLSYSTASSGKETCIEAHIGYFQVDNQLPLTSMPILLSPELPVNILYPIFQLEFTISNENISGTEAYPYIGIQVAENCWRLNVHEPIIWALMDVFNNINFQRLTTNPTLSQVDPEIRIKKIHISEARIRVSLQTSPAQRPHGIFGFWTPIIATVGSGIKMHIHFRKVDQTNKFMRKSSITEAIVNRIWRDLIHNPFHLLSGVNVLGMTSSTLATLSKGVAKLSTDGEFLMLRSKQDRSRRIMGVGDGILQGSEAFAQSVAFGFSGVVTKPFSSAQEDGFKGFVQGMGRAFLGVIVQPVSGALDFASLTVTGIGASFTRIIEVFDRRTVSKRIRLPRAVRENGILEEYNARAAFGQMVLQAAEASRSFGCTEIFKERSKFAWSDYYEEHVDLPHGYLLLLTNQRIMMVQCNKVLSKPSKILWDVPLNELLALEFIKGGQHQASHVILHLKYFKKSEKFVRVIKCKGEDEQEGIRQATVVHSCIQNLWKAYKASKRVSDSEVVGRNYSFTSGFKAKTISQFSSKAEASFQFHDSDTDRSSSSYFSLSGKFREHTVTFEHIWSSDLESKFRCAPCPKLDNEDKEICSIWRPVCPEGYIFVGDIAHTGRHQPTVSAIYKHNSREFVPPVTFELVWRNCPDDYARPLSIWVPVAPEGYVAIGCVAVAGYSEPETNNVFCAHSSLVEETTFEDQPIWSSPDNYPWACFFYQVRSEALPFVAMRKPKESATWNPYRVIENRDGSPSDDHQHPS